MQDDDNKIGGVHESDEQSEDTTQDKYGEDFYSSKIGEKGGKSQGEENNPGNFANDRDKAKRAGHEGGKR